MKAWIVLSAIAGGLAKFQVLFHTAYSTLSHMAGMLEVAKELQSQGHQVVYAAPSEYLKYADGMNLTTILLPSRDIKFEEGRYSRLQRKLELERAGQKVPVELENHDVFYYDYISLFPSLRRLLQENKYSVVVCDIFAIACRDAAEATGTPVVTGLQGPSFLLGVSNPHLRLDMHYGPSSLSEMTLRERIYDTLITPIKSFNRIKYIRMHANKARSEFGIAPNASPLGNLDRSLILSTSFFGFEPAAKVPPYVHLIGPFERSVVPSLTEELHSFLDSRQKVLYVGFGSLAPISQADVEQLGLVFAELLAHKKIDGVVFAAGPAAKYLDPSEDVVGVTWAPQVAILKHPSVQLFLSHCGLSGVHESALAGKPILCMPLYGDQPSNAAKVEEAGFGKYLPRNAEVSYIFKAASTLLLNQQEPLKSNLERIRSLATLRSQSASRVGAGLIKEYATLAHICRPLQAYKPGDIPCEVSHLIPSSQFMSILKRNRLDILSLVAVGLAAILFIIYRICLLFAPSPKKPKSD